MSPITELIGGAKAYGWGSFAAVGDFESIATATVGSGGSQDVNFTSIPATYTHLQIRYIARSSNAADALDTNWVRFNSDTGSNYAFHYLTGNGSAAGTGSGANQNYAIGGIWPYNSTTANAFGAGVIDILDYANTNKFKTVRTLSGAEVNSSTSQIWFNSSLWLSTSAINAIQIKAVNSNTFGQYTTFALYGIKGA